eukprot:XP_011661716.1 PREDICTED: calponin homology domain-containing protein DDB_G0272472 [Strongylocentrotus purpuratus]
MKRHLTGRRIGFSRLGSNLIVPILPRPSISDQQKVGFFRQDRASQTLESEILELKQMTFVLQTLLRESKELKRELAVAKQVMRADYENKLQEKALDMYCRINEHVEALEKAHRERVEVVRRSFRQQLTNSIAKIAHDWKNHASKKMNAELKKQNSNTAALQDEHKALQNQVASQEGIIEMLKMQLEQQANAPRSEASTPTAVYEVEALKDEMVAMKRKVDGLESALDGKDELIEELNRDMERLNKDVEKERIHIKQLLKELEESKATAMQEISSLKRQAEKQRLNQEKDMQEKMKKSRDEMLNLAKQHAADAQKAEEARMKLEAEKEKQERELQKNEQATFAKAAESGEEISKLNRLEKHLRGEIARLKKELAKSTKLWEKKFSVLQRSMYALKDESYLRQTLQKQAATLHHATVTYANDAPGSQVSRNAAIQPQAPQPTPNTKHSKGPHPPLPGIGQINPTRDRKLDVMSAYTVSPPPGRGIELFSVNEGQIVEPDDDYEAFTDGNFLPLPTPPPPRWINDDSRPPSANPGILMAS